MDGQTLIVDARFRGPPDSGNGGYVCGLVGAALGGPARVTLRRPPPIGRPMLLRAVDRGLSLLDGGELVAEGVRTRLKLDVPDPIERADAEAASRDYAGFARHSFPTCFVCGPERGEGDGLRIFPGPVPGRDLVAAPWAPGRELANGEGSIRPEFVWAALDCPGAFAVGFPETPMLLGRLAAKLVRAARVGERCVVLGWSEGSEGRKRFASTALLGEAGDLLATATAPWIAPASSSSSPRLGSS